MSTNYHASYYDLDHGHWHTGGEHETLDAAREAVRHADVWNIENDDGEVIESSDDPKDAEALTRAAGKIELAARYIEASYNLILRACGLPPVKLRKD